MAEGENFQTISGKYFVNSAENSLNCLQLLLLFTTIVFFITLMYLSLDSKYFW